MKEAQINGRFSLECRSEIVYIWGDPYGRVQNNLHEQKSFSIYLFFVPFGRFYECVFHLEVIAYDAYIYKERKKVLATASSNNIHVVWLM